MKRYAISILLALAAFTSCDPKPDPDNGGGKKATAWSVTTPLTSKVEVFVANTPVESFEYTYDNQNRPLTLVRKDLLGGTTLLNLSYSYEGESGMNVSGTFYPIETKRYITATKDNSKGRLIYKGSWSGAWTKETAFNSDGTAVSTLCNTSFSAESGKYSSETSFREDYSVSSGNISEIRYAPTVSSAAAKSTKSESSTGLEYSYTYTDKPDKQNFGLYLFHCEFPVWFAASLPGCSRLVESMSVKHNSTSYPVYFKMR